MAIVNVKDFGAIGDGVTDDTTAFLSALDMLLNTFERGYLYCPSGSYILTQELVITKPFIGIKGDGIEVTSLIFSGNGIKLMNGAQQPPGGIVVAYGAIEDIKIFGSNLNNNNNLDNVGISLDQSHYYFFNRIWIQGFDIGIDAHISQYIKLNDFIISHCRIAAQFIDTCLFTTILNGNIRECIEAGIIEIGSEIYINLTDIEAVGVAIRTGNSTTIRDCHFEQCDIVVALSAAFSKVTVENCTIVGCGFGIKQTHSGTINGRYYFKRIGFAATTTEFDIPGTTIYQIEDCTAVADGGGAKGMVVNAEPLYGIIKNPAFSLQGNWVSYSNTPGILVNGKTVFAGFQISEYISFGTIPANDTSVFNIAIPTGMGISVYSTVLSGGITFSDLAPGIILTFFIRTNGSSSYASQIGLHITNTTGVPHLIGDRTAIVYVA